MFVGENGATENICGQVTIIFSSPSHFPLAIKERTLWRCGEDWFGSFLARRHLSVRTPEATSLGRAGYVSPREILPLPKCPPRTQTKRKRVKTAILTDTPEKQAIEKVYKERQKKLAGKKQNSKEKGKPKKKATKKKIIVSSSEESDVPVPIDNVSEEESSEDERSDPGNSDLSMGDFVIVNFATKQRSVRYIGMIEKVEDDEILAQFLRRIQGNTKEWERPTFVIKENDVAHVPKSDVVKKLPQPKRPGGTTRREQLLIFPCNLQGWNVE
ncbi:uncharacterized protein LOC127624545 [Xyrauchen texanus]|uniref:uncharacterized protein LOC127624545 n=1 Tax=Xyrauchen texanus TaxID=154827 RepID=UPI002242923A|nr:uncharacterized protein LOC127624545 [Xyrauchen texanus]